MKFVSHQRIIYFIFKFLFKNIADRFHYGLTVSMRILISGVLLLLHSCAGYRPIGLTNILSKNNISSIVVNQTSNDSSFYNVSHYFSQSIIRELSHLKGVVFKNLLSGAPNEGVLVTRLISDFDKSKSISVDAMKFIDKSTGYESSIGDRKGFYINYQLGYSLQLEVVLIKNPKRVDSGSDLMPEVIFKKIFPIQFKTNNISNSVVGGFSWGNKLCYEREY